MAFSDGPIQAIDRKKAALFALLKNWAGELESYAKGHVPWNDRTSHARQGIHSDVDDKGNEFELYIAHSKEYGEYLETGTGIYGPKQQAFTIAPKSKKALFWPGARHPVRKPITHPGMKKRAIIIPTLEIHIERIKRTIRELWEG